MSIFPTSGSFILYDTEFTSWPGFMAQGFKAPGKYPEVIQIGAVRVDAANGYAELDAADIFVIPRINPTLSDYIIDLTGITQARLDAAGVPFKDALSQFLRFIGDANTPIYSYGEDGTVMQENCELNDLPSPALFDGEINLKQTLADAGLAPTTLASSELPALFGLPPEVQGHDALSDARAVLRVLRHLKMDGRLG